MEVLTRCSEQQLCPCYKEYQEFHKLVELNDSGLVIYCHRSCPKNTSQGTAAESAVNTSRDVFILHNKKDVKITISQLTSELEKKNISCPRCRKIFEHAQELMQELKSIDRKIVMGICDHCRKRALVGIRPFCACDKIVKLYKSNKGEQTEDTKTYVKVWSPKMEHVRKDKQKENHEYSNLQINRDLNSPAVGHEPAVQQMFYSDTHFKSDDTQISETDSKEGYIKQAVAFIEPIKPMKTSLVPTHNDFEITMPKISGIALVDSNTAFVETYVGVKELPRPSIKDRDTPSADAKEELKRRHDLSLRQMVRLAKDSGDPFSISKRPDVYEIPKVAPWEQKEPMPKYHVESEIKIKHDLGSRNPDYASNRPAKFGSSRKKRSLQHAYLKLNKLDSGVGKVKKAEHRGAKSKTRPIEPKFSYSFPKKTEKKVKEITVKSSELKNTQEKFHLKSERLKKSKGKERQQKLEQEQKTKQEAEEKNKFAGEQQKLTKRHKSSVIFLEKTGETKAKNDTKSKPEQQDGVADKSRPEEQDEGAKKKEKLKAEKENFKTEGGKLNTEKEETVEKEKIKTTKGESDEKVASAKTGKSDKKIQDFSSHIEGAKSNIENIKNKKDKSVVDKEIEEFQELKPVHLKAKEAAMKKKLETEAQNAKQVADLDLKITKKPIKQARSQNYLKLVKIKQAWKITARDIDCKLLKAHTIHHKPRQQLLSCPLCCDSELELEVYSINNQRYLKKAEITNIIIGEKTYKYKLGLEKIKKQEDVPIFFQKDLFLENDFEVEEKVQIIPQEAEPVKKKIPGTNLSKKDEKEIEMEPGKGVIRYALSDRSFIDKGWTLLPTEKVVRMMNVYRMRPAHPEFDWFEHNKNKRLMTYDTGERLAEFDDNGRGRWYYRSGRLALDYYDAKETNAQQRFVIYSSGEPDVRGRTHPITILATFDYLGNGIVFDHAGKIRLKYNQSEGVVLDRAIGPVSHWKWHTLNDPPILHQVMIDTQMAHKDPDILKLGLSEEIKTRPDNEEMLAIEFDNFIKEKNQKLSQKFERFQIKMKALKINEQFSLKVLDQATVYLIFRDGSTNLKINMGMILDDKEIVDTDTAEVGEVSNSLEQFPARTDSLAGLQRSVAHAQRYERQHAERMRRLRPPEPCASTDLLTAAISPPKRLPCRTLPTVPSSTTQYCRRKPSNNLCYNTRLFC